MFRYIMNVLITTDRLINTLLGGHPNKTISQRMGLWYIIGGWRAVVAFPMCWVLDRLHSDHCINCLENDDYERKRTHVRYRRSKRK